MRSPTASGRKVYGTAYSMWTETGPDRVHPAAGRGLLHRRRRAGRQRRPPSRPGSSVHRPARRRRLPASRLHRERRLDRRAVLRRQGHRRIPDHPDQQPPATMRPAATTSRCCGSRARPRGRGAAMSVDCPHCGRSPPVRAPKEAAAAAQLPGQRRRGGYSRTGTTRGVPPTATVADAIATSSRSTTSAPPSTSRRCRKENLLAHVRVPARARPRSPRCWRPRRPRWSSSRQTPAQAAQILVETAASDLSA